MAAQVNLTSKVQPTSITTKSYTIAVAASFTEEPKTSKIAVPIGGSLLLSCEAEGNPPPTTSWSKDEHALDESRSILRQNNAVFLIANFRSDDTGRYICRVYNGIGQELHRTFSVSVRGEFML